MVRKVPDAGVCNAIADFLWNSRVQVYGLAGWLDLGEQDDEALTILLTSFTATLNNFRSLSGFTTASVIRPLGLIFELGSGKP